MNYGTDQPLAASTPRANSTLTRETQVDDTYHQIIPGMSKHLYSTLIADGSLSTPAADNCSTLQKQITELDKYLQEATEKHERDDNYYDGWHMATNTSSPQQEANRMMMQVVMKKTIKQVYQSLMGKTPVHTTKVLQDTTSNLRMS